MSSKTVSALLLAFVAVTFPILAEIQVVVLQWTPLLCATQNCIALLERELQRIPRVAEFSINQPGGQATLKWQPNAPFAFSDVNVPMRLVGLSIRDIHITVRGKLSHDPRSVTLTSIGDNTRFQLINPVISTPGQQASVFNLAARQLTPELRQKFLDAEAQNLIATISGQIFMPGRSPALQIVVGNVSFAEPSDKK